MTKLACRSRTLALAWVLCCAAALGPIQAARVRSLTLADMASRAGTIFVGRCTGVTANPGGPSSPRATTYTFEVRTAIKGAAGAGGRISFRFPGTPQQPLVDYLPGFDVGQEALVLLYPASPAGFSTPMGINQGSFRILRTPGRSPQVVNGTANRGLLADVPEESLRARGLRRDAAGPLDLETIVSLLGELAGRGSP